MKKLIVNFLINKDIGILIIKRSIVLDNKIVLNSVKLQTPHVVEIIKNVFISNAQMRYYLHML